MSIRIALASLVLLASSPQASETETVEDLAALARLYGYVRYFHPSDEAAETNWNAFSVHAAHRVIHRDEEPLADVLGELFGPLAPTMVLYANGDAPPRAVPDAGARPGSAHQVSWQHQGVALDMDPSPYRSVRTGKRDVDAGRFGAFAQVLSAEVAGSRIRFTGRAMAEPADDASFAWLWLRAADGSTTLELENMDERPITSPVWQQYEILMDVPRRTTEMNLGGGLTGAGIARFDDFELEVWEDDAWRPRSLQNRGFEDGSITGWITSSSEYEFTVQDDGAGGQYLVAKGETLGPGMLFATMPEENEFIDESLGGGLRVRMPIALWGDENRTFGANEVTRDSLERLRDQMNSASTDQTSVAVAAVVAAWSTLQHFYPYWDVVDVDWADQLHQSLRQALAVESREDAQIVLELLVASIDDGHGSVLDTARGNWGIPPFLVEWIEGELIVVEGDRSVRRGDVIRSVDGQPVDEYMDEKRRRRSGSDQWKRFETARFFGRGKVGAALKLELERNGRTIVRNVSRVRWSARPAPRSRRQAIRSIGEVVYVDLNRATMPEISSRIDEIARAPGVVFDLRGYPKDNIQVIRHLLTEADTSGAWMQIPQIVRPDWEGPVDYSRAGWGLTPLEPHIAGRVAFITDGRAVSAAESFMSFIEHYRLGEIVGSPTAGANGNVNRLNLPGDFSMVFTGMKVVKHDGSQLHLIGVRPTVPVERTIAGVKAGRDELLEEALRVVTD